MNLHNITPKPEGYKTIKQWEKEGRIPVSDKYVKLYYATNKEGQVVIDKKTGKPAPYYYVAPEHTKEIEKDVSFSSPSRFSIENKKIICFDTETTGFSKWDEIIQISVFEMDSNTLEINEVLSTLVKPVMKRSWNEASKVNGIYPEDVKDAPTMRELKSFLQNVFQSADIIVGHNVSFDIKMLKQCAYISLDKKEIFDTLRLFKQDRSEGKHKLINAVEYYIPEQKEWFEAGAHKADTDTKATLMILREMIQRDKEKTTEDISFIKE